MNLLLKAFQFVSLLLFPFMLIGCAPSEERMAAAVSETLTAIASPTPNVPKPTKTPKPTITPLGTTNFDDICTLPSNTLVLVKGYVYLPDFVVLSFGSYNLSLAKTRAYPLPYEERINIRIKAGNKVNEMDTLPETFLLSSLKVTSDDGKTIGHGDYVTVRGITTNDSSDGSCGININKIYKNK